MTVDDSPSSPARATVYAGLSVDGFIARPDHTVDFLDAGGPPDSDMGFGAFMASVDVLVMGRNTFDFVVASGYDWPYGDTPVVVVTSRPLVIPDGVTTVEATALEPAVLREELSERGLHHAYIDGGLTVQSWIRAGLVDDLILTQVPILIGDGLPLFGSIPADIELDLVDTTRFDNGCVQTHWRVG